MYQPFSAEDGASSVSRIHGSHIRLGIPQHRYVTMKVAALVAVPPGVVILILPVIAPVGTVAVTCVAEFTVNVALTPPKVT